MLSMFYKRPKSALFQRQAPICAETGAEIMWLLCLQSVMSWHIISYISHSKSHSCKELWPHEKLLQHSFKGEIQGLQACIANSGSAKYLQKDMSSVKWQTVEQTSGRCELYLNTIYRIPRFFSKKYVIWPETRVILVLIYLSTFMILGNG